MTIPSTPRRAGPYIGTGALVTYPFSFKVFSKTDVAVTLADTSGNETPLVLDSSLLVTVNPDQTALPGGTVQYAIAGVAAALPAGYSITILTAVEYKQATQLPTGGNYRAEIVESGLDSLAVQIQQQGEVLARALVFSPTDATGSTLPPAASRAGRLLGFDSNGRAVAVAPTSGSVAAFALDLANTSSATKGAGLSGFDFSLLYAAMTSGWGTRVAARGLSILRYVPVAQWAAALAGTSTDDHTTYIQQAINAASNSMETEVFFPAGKWNYTRLYCYYDAALNPGFNINRNAEVWLNGAGYAPENGGTGGTVLNCTSTTGDGVTVSPASEDGLY